MGGGGDIKKFQSRICFSLVQIFSNYFFRLGLAQKLMDQTAASMVEAFNAKVGLFIYSAPLVLFMEWVKAWCQQSAKYANIRSALSFNMQFRIGLIMQIRK